MSAGPARTVGVGVVGMGWMGAAHARAWRAAPLRFPESGAQTRLAVCADAFAARAESARAEHGFARAAADWREVVRDPEVDVVSVTAPNNMHLEIIRAAAENGKHIYCEKPAGRNADETAQAESAARAAGVFSAVGYNYRLAPMAQFCRKLLDDGKLGKPEQVNCRFLSMYGADPLGMLTWRFDAEIAGHGAAGDILAHALDTAQFLGGRVARVCGTTRTFIAERPLPVPGRGTHFSTGRPEDPKGKVGNEDYAAALLEFADGAAGTAEASRVARGPKCEMTFEVFGEKGSARWNFERMNEMELFCPDGTPEHDGFVRIVAGENHPPHGRFNPGDGIGAGYEDLKTIEAANLLAEIVSGAQAESGLARALSVSRTVAAVLRSRKSRKWEEVEQ